LGFPVEVDPTFLVVAVILGATLGGGPATLVVFVAVFFAAILWHELGHALAFRAFGFSPSISVHGMGGHAASSEELTPGRDIVVSLAGPLAGLVLGALVLATASPVNPADAEGMLQTALSLVAWVNVGLGVFNLIPMLPLDGGRAMAGGLTLVLGHRGGRVAALMVSLAVGVASVALALAVGAYFIVLLAAWYGYGNLRALESVLAAPPPRPAVGEADYAEWLAYGWSSLAEGGATAAANRARDVLANSCTPTPLMRMGAMRLLLWSSLARGDYDEASTLAPVMDPTSAVLDGEVLAATAGADQALEQLQALFEHHPNDATGALLARGLVESARLDQAISVVDGPWSASLGHEAHAVVGSALFATGRYEEAARLAERSFERQPHPTLGYNIACSWARSGDVEAALAWLAKAVDAGYRDAGQLLGDEDFVAVRRAPGFSELERRLAPRQGAQSGG
jgi:Zn-dependent protease